jgi:recombination protein RecA
MIAALVKQTAKNYEASNIGVFSGPEAMDDVERWIPSTSVSINYQLGDPRYGAFACCKLIELFGPKSSSKSLILYDAGAHCQRQGGMFILLDGENAFHRGFAQSLGLSTSREKFIYASIPSIEDSFKFVTVLIKKLRAKNYTGHILIGVDSITAILTKRELRREFDDEKAAMGHKAKVLSERLPKIINFLPKYNATMIAINQIRTKIGVVFGNPEFRTGGAAVQFYASQSMEVRKTKKIKKGRRTIGHENSCYVEKNRVRPPFGKSIIHISTDKIKRIYGLDAWSGLLDTLLIDDVIEHIKGTKNMYRICGNRRVKFSTQKIGDAWPEILKTIPEDIYAIGSTGDGKKKKIKKIKIKRT